MDRSRAKELLPIIQAFADGEEIQSKNRDQDTWATFETYDWNGNAEYRIKPAESREFWIADVEDNSREVIPASIHGYSSDPEKWIKVREVL